MRRLLSTVALDVRLQARNRFYVVSALFVAGIAFALTRLDAALVPLVAPIAILFGLTGTTFFYVAGLLHLERVERTLDALVVTPLRPREYLASKTLTLTLLGVAEAVAIVALSVGPGFRVIPLVAGAAALGAVYTLTGFVLASRKGSITDFLVPAILWTFVLGLPAIPYAGLWDSPASYLLPTQGPFLLVVAAFRDVPAADLAYAVAASAAVAALTAWWARASFERHAVREPGGA